MRTTVTLDPDVQLLVNRAMKEGGLTFKQAVNEAIRAGAAPPSSSRRPSFEAHDMGDALVDVTKALQLVGELEDQELARKLSQGK
jgi:hypothetical protein